MSDYRPRIVVSGSRVWGSTSDNPEVGSPAYIARAERAVTIAVLNHFLSIHGDEMILVHGAARGLDRLAGNWAEDRHIAIEDHPADWDALGRAAGNFRNAQMIASRTEAVVAFWTRDHRDPTRLSRGTENMIGMSRRHGIPVFVYRSPFWSEVSDLAGQVAS